MTETTTARLPRRAIAGVLSNLQRLTVDGIAIATATLTTTFQDKTVVRAITVPAVVLANGAVDHLLAEGPVVRFYAEVGDGVATIIGPDLTKRTLIREASVTGETAVAPAAKPRHAKRPRTEAQKRAWAEIILPKLQAGRARKAAEKAAAAQAAAGETAQAA